MYIFKLAYYDVGLMGYLIPLGETLQDSQRVIYENHRAVWDHYSPITEISSGK